MISHWLKETLSTWKPDYGWWRRKGFVQLKILHWTQDLVLLNRLEQGNAWWPINTLCFASTITYRQRIFINFRRYSAPGNTCKSLQYHEFVSSRTQIRILWFNCDSIKQTRLLLIFIEYKLRFSIIISWSALVRTWTYMYIHRFRHRTVLCNVHPGPSDHQPPACHWPPQHAAQVP